MRIPVHYDPTETRFIPVQHVEQRIKTSPIVLGEGSDKHGEQRLVHDTYEPREFAVREPLFRSTPLNIETR